jgi:hypothetical protein
MSVLKGEDEKSEEPLFIRFEKARAIVEGHCWCVKNGRASLYICTSVQTLKITQIFVS